MTVKETKLKRGYFHDYHAPSIYLITVTVVDRESLLGGVVGEHAFVELTEVGKAVKREICAIPQRYLQVQALQYQIMPEHVHFVLRVHERLPELMPIGNVVAAWKQACGKVYSAILWRDLAVEQSSGVQSGDFQFRKEGDFALGLPFGLHDVVAVACRELDGPRTVAAVDLQRLAGEAERDDIVARPCNLTDAQTHMPVRPVKRSSGRNRTCKKSPPTSPSSPKATMTAFYMARASLPT